MCCQLQMGKLMQKGWAELIFVRLNFFKGKESAFRRMYLGLVVNRKNIKMNILFTRTV